MSDVAAAVKVMSGVVWYVVCKAEFCAPRRCRGHHQAGGRGGDEPDYSTWSGGAGSDRQSLCNTAAGTVGETWALGVWKVRTLQLHRPDR